MTTQSDDIWGKMRDEHEQRFPKITWIFTVCRTNKIEEDLISKHTKPDAKNKVCLHNCQIWLVQRIKNQTGDGYNDLLKYVIIL